MVLKAWTNLVKRLQRILGALLFPRVGDWYKKHGYTSNDPNEQLQEMVQTSGYGHYDDPYKGVLTKLHMEREALLTNNGALDVMRARPKTENPDLPGHGKHILFFPGAGTPYEAYFKDIMMISDHTGASVHAFNYPGVSASSGSISKPQDPVNAGLEVVQDMIAKYASSGDMSAADKRKIGSQIILQGDCMGSHIAEQVAVELWKQGIPSD